MSKTRMGKRIASLLLSLVMMLSLLPTTVYATEDTGGGTGATTDEIVGQANTSGTNTEETGKSGSTGEDKDGSANVNEGEGGAAADVSEGEGNDVSVTDGYTYDNATGTVTPATTTAVAKIDETGYATLAGAVEAAEPDATVTLLANTTEDVAINKNITLDLNGFTLTNTSSGKATLTIAKGATATVKNGSVVGGNSYYTIQNNGTATLEGVTATAGNTGSSMIDNFGTLTINSGDYSGGLNVVKSEEGSTLTITGGKFTLDYATNGYTGVVFAYGDTTISGGEFIQSLTTTGRWNHPQVIATGVVEGYTAITRVTGGHFVNKMSEESIFRGIGKGTSDNFEVSGGTFNKSVSEGYCADGFIPTKNADGTYGVKEGQYVAEIGTKKYETLAKAIQLAAKDKTVTLLANVTENVTIPAGKALTLDLNGHTITNVDGKDTITVQAQGKLTITDSSAEKTGTVDNVTHGHAAIVNYGTMTLEAGTYTRSLENPENNKDSAGGNSYYTILNDKGGEMTINNGVKVINNGHFSSMIRNGGDETAEKTSVLTINGGMFSGGINTVKNANLGKLTITDGTFTNTTQFVVMNWNEAAISGGTFETAETAGAVLFSSAYGTDGTACGELTITGGTFKAAGNKLIDDAYDANNHGTVKISGGSFNRAVDPKHCADGFIPKDNGDGTYGVKGQYVAQVLDKNGNPVGDKYETLQAAIDAATRNQTVTMLANTRENVTIDKALTLDLNGFTLNGGTVKGTPTLKIDTARVTVMDSSEAKTGTIMREDTAENSGVSSHYVIDIQGKNALLTFNSGNVRNNSGNAEGKGASLVRVGNDSDKKAHSVLTIEGGTFTQDNFIVIKVDFGTLHLKGGTVNSKTSYAVENWLNANIKEDAVVNGAVSSWTYSTGSNSTLEISGGTVNGNVESVSYDGAEGKLAKVKISGGTVNGTLSTKCYSATAPSKDMATIEITGGTFTDDPTKYVVESSKVTKNSEGKYGVEKAYLAKVGETSYYTMDEAFKAQTASGEAIVLLRDYTTGSPFHSGTVARTVDLNGHTWTCTGTDANSAAFEINNPDVTLTVKNGKVVSSQLVGLIPSAMGGTIKYDNSSLMFEGVEMSTTATSGIETNGNNTNDTVTLKDSTLNVPNGFGIYFPSSGTLTIDNSTINAKTMGVQVCAGSLSINAGSAITVTGDAVPKTENDGAIQDGAAISIVNRTGYKGLDKIEVTGGKFTAKTGNAAIKAYNWNNKTESEWADAGKYINVSGGTFSSIPDNMDGLCKDGFVPVKNADGYAVQTGTYVASIGTKKFATLAEAVEAAKDGDTVTLLDDVNTPTTSYVIRKSLTIDLNGRTVTGSGYDAVFQIDSADAKVIIKNGKVVAVEQSDSAGKKYTMAVWASEAGCEVTLEGLDVSQKITHADDPQMDMIYASGGTITINSGNFVSGTPAWTLNCYDPSYKEGTAKIIVKGGTFANFDPANNRAEDKNTSFVAAGYVSNMDADGSYTVVPANASIKVNKRLTIGNDLTMTYLVTLSNCTDARVKFQFYNDDIKGYTEVMVENGTEEADGRFAFDFTGINPQRMTDTLKATVYATDVSGDTIEYQVDDYSVAQYCINTLKKSTTTDRVKKLIGNLVAYGAAAQVYKNYREDNLVSSIVTGVESTDYVATELSKVTSYGNNTEGTAGINIVSKTLVLSNTFAVRVYFTLDEGIDIGNVRFTVTANNKVNEVNSFQKDSKGRWYFDYAKLNATQLDSKVTFKSLVVGTEGDTLEYSVNTYLAKMMPRCDKNSNLYKFMAELFNYGCACKEFE